MVKVLVLADTHLGYDYPLKPRIQRRRRGQDFFNNFWLALKPARLGEVDLVVHGGDLFTRSRIPEALVEEAMAPLKQVADLGIPVILVPGNHERSKIPLNLWSVHPNLFIFRFPYTFQFDVGGAVVALSGYPFVRKVQQKFADLVRCTGYRDKKAEIRLLCLHQAVEGAQVGPVDYTFKDGPDVIRGRDIPSGFAAVISGHIHRAQHLTHDLKGQDLPAPVIYPGSVERTAFTERYEEKGYFLLGFEKSNIMGGRLVESEFVELPARPMVVLALHPTRLEAERLEEKFQKKFAKLDPNSVVQIRIMDDGTSWLRQRLTARCLRELAPASMNISVARNRTGGKQRTGKLN